MADAEIAIERRNPKGASYSVPRALLLLSGSTLLSRIFGLAREIVMSALFTPLVTDAFIVAFRIPNLLRRLFGEGALSVSVVPVLTQTQRREGEAGARVLVNSLFSVATIIFGILVLFGVLGAPLIVKWIAPGSGFSEIPHKVELTVFLLRMTFPYIFFAGLHALCMGVLNSRKHFFAPAFSPVIYNGVQILAMLGLGYWMGHSGIEMGIGVLVGGLLQLLLQIPYLRKSEVWPSWNPDFSHPGVRKVGRLMAPSLLGLSAAQLSFVILTMYASYLPQGSISYLFWADRLMELPLGILAVAAGTASLPLMSELAQEGDLKGLYHYTLKGLRILSFYAVPATIGLVVLREPIIRVLFERGEFGREDTLATANALFFFGWGLWASAAVRLLAPAFYAMQNSKIPALSALLAVAVQVSLGWILMQRLGAGGLALAVSIGLFANFSLLFCLLTARRGRGSGVEIRALIGGLLRITAASLLMGAGVAFLWRIFSPFWQRGSWQEGGALFLLIGSGAILYSVIAWFLKCEDLKYLLAKLSTFIVDKLGTRCV